MGSKRRNRWKLPALSTLPASEQGSTLVHFSAQRKRFLWDRGFIIGLTRGLFRWRPVELGVVSGVFCVRNG